MSGIAAIYNLDGRPVDPGLLKRLIDAIAHRGPDGMGQWIAGAVGLGHRMLHTTPESLVERQPLTDEAGRLCLSFDGRLDNREELRAALLRQGARLRTDTDAEMVLLAYECWGTKFLARLIGDFSLALWDESLRQLLCARDFLGMKPLFYYVDAGRFVCGSELQQLFVDPQIERIPNEGMVGEHLTGFITNLEETLYRGILRLPPAHFLLVGPNGVRKERYWDIDPSREIRYKTDDEYAEHFLSIFKEAVRCRLRSYGRVGAHLSGGMDSSSIVSMTARLLCEGQAPDNGFETFSMVYPAGWPCDERVYIEAVTQMCGVKGNLVEQEVAGFSHYLEQVQRYQDVADYPNGGSQALSLNELARTKGVRVMLTGAGGNEWLEGGLDYFADLFRGLKLGKLASRARIEARLFNDPSPFGLVWHRGVLPAIPPKIRRAGKRLLGRINQLPSWLDEQFTSRINLRERLLIPETGHKFASFSQRRMFQTTVDGFQEHGYGIGERISAWFGREDRHPFDDQRLVEFALGLPEEQRRRESQTKFVLRKAMKDHLPEEVLHRKVQGDFSILFPKALEKVGADLAFGQLAIGAAGWVKPASVTEMYTQMMRRYEQDDPDYRSYIWPLWAIWALELWFRTMFLPGTNAGSRDVSRLQETVITSSALVA